jgi:hypothetical protein
MIDGWRVEGAGAESAIAAVPGTGPRPGLVAQDPAASP